MEKKFGPVNKRLLNYRAEKAAEELLGNKGKPISKKLLKQIMNTDRLLKSDEN